MSEYASGEGDGRQTFVWLTVGLPSRPVSQKPGINVDAVKAPTPERDLELLFKQAKQLSRINMLEERLPQYALERPRDRRGDRNHGA